MSPKAKINLLKAKLDKLSFAPVALMLIPLLVSMSACTDLSVADKNKELASIDATGGTDKIVFPDSKPSVFDGAVYWQKNQCASCHGDAGVGVAGSCDVDMTNPQWMRLRKPVDQYKAIAFGKGEIYKEPVLSKSPAQGESEPVLERKFDHPAFSKKLSRREIWDLVFYTRSLAVPLLSSKDYDAITPVFGSNCAVCHGTKGAGDGPLNKGLVLQPTPANFNQYNRFYDRTDEQIWDHIANGIKWEGMPNFLGKEDKPKGVKFDGDYIWKLVQYVRSFHEMPEAELEKGALQAAPSGEEAAAPKADDSKKAESAETTKPEINTDQPNDKDQAPVGSGAAEPTSR